MPWRRTGEWRYSSTHSKSRLLTEASPYVSTVYNIYPGRPVGGTRRRISASYLGGTRFESLPGVRIPFFSRFPQSPHANAQIGHDRFFKHPLKFIRIFLNRYHIDYHPVDELSLNKPANRKVSLSWLVRIICSEHVAPRIGSWKAYVHRLSQICYT